MNLIFSTNQLLADASFYLSKIDNATYSKHIPLLLNASIGQHTRHYIELYQCLLWRKEKKIINYDSRPRNRLIETDTAAAQKIIRTIQIKLTQIEIGEKIFLQSAMTDSDKVVTSIERELIYNYEHCLHHLAIIKIGLHTIQPNLVLPNHFGIAPSTLVYRQTANKQ